MTLRKADFSPFTDLRFPSNQQNRGRDDEKSLDHSSTTQNLIGKHTYRKRENYATRVNFIGITGRSCFEPLIVGEARPLIFQTISFELGEKMKDSRRMDRTSSEGLG